MVAALLGDDVKEGDALKQTASFSSCWDVIKPIPVTFVTPLSRTRSTISKISHQAEQNGFICARHWSSCASPPSCKHGAAAGNNHTSLLESKRWGNVWRYPRRALLSRQQVNFCIPMWWSVQRGSCGANSVSFFVDFVSHVSSFHDVEDRYFWRLFAVKPAATGHEEMQLVHCLHGPWYF